MQTVSLYFALNQSNISKELKELQDISNPDFSNQSFNPILFNLEIFNSLAPKIMVENFMFEKSGVKKLTFEKFGVETSRVEKLLLALRVDTFMVEKSSWCCSWGLKSPRLKSLGLKCPVILEINHFG